MQVVLLLRFLIYLQLTSFPAGFDQLIIHYVIISSIILIGIIVGVILVARREHIHHIIMDMITRVYTMDNIVMVGYSVGIDS
jgi:hypothetical protein